MKNTENDTNFNSPLGVGGHNYDALVIGGGIAGQEAALSLADMDHKVLLVEKGLSIGGGAARRTSCASGSRPGCRPWQRHPRREAARPRTGACPCAGR